jgi:hypothetical protein
MELVITVLAIAAVTTLAGLGIAALPWTEAELVQSEGAVRALPELVRAPASVGGRALESLAMGRVD